AFPGGATEAVLARADLFPDALAGSYLAGDVGGPILLTESNSLHPEALSGLTNLGVTTVHLMGSDAALSETVRDSLDAAGFTTERIGGADRYATAAAVATTPGAAAVGSAPGFGPTAIVASGVNFPDALASGPISYRNGFPLLLTLPGSLPEPTAEALDSLAIDHVLLVGGTTAVSDTVKTAIEALGITVERRSGPDRYATAADLAGYARDTLGFVVDELILATGTNFPDAVASGPLGGERQAPIVLTADPLPAPSAAVCEDNQPTLTGLLVEGGTAAVSDAAVDACKDLAEGAPPLTPTLAGYVWADQPASAAYTPSSFYQYNSSGGSNTIARSGVGTYTVALPGLGVDEGTVLVTAYGGGPERCKVVSWNAAAADLAVRVNCFDAAGAAVDVEFDATFLRPTPGYGPMGYVWANEAASASYTPSAPYQYNSTGTANTIDRSAVGVYAVTLPGLAGAGEGHVEVTAYGSGNEHCKVSSWGPSGADQVVNVRCFDAAGAAVDSRFTTTFVDGASLVPKPGAPSAYLWANDPVNAAYTPSPTYQFNSSGGVNNITRSGVGDYLATLAGVGTPGGHIQVTAYGSSSDHCVVDSWGPSGGDLAVGVNCVDIAGAAADTRFVLAWTG
ncbi:MAG: cell wall-binding repeat-containing protein, partial [Acidimicrobiia bacterium]